MNTLKSIYEQSAPDTLYHYTSQDGFIGIMHSENIWCTKIHYLNDTTEFRLAIDLAREILDQRKRDATNNKYAEKVKFLLRKVNSIEHINVCVCSFSEEGDMISQWRAYCGRHSGYSLGFDTKTLRAIGDSARFTLAPCVYDPEVQTQLVRELIDTKLQEGFPMGGWEADPSKENTFIALPQDHEFAYKLTALAPILKNEAFAEEREWRLISPAISVHDSNFSFRSGLSMITPYFKLSLLTEGSLKVLNKIIVGPTPHTEQALESVKSIFASKRLLQNTEIKASSIPYRNW